FRHRGRAALSRVLGALRDCGAAHARGIHPEGEPADQADSRTRREHERCSPIQIHNGAARRESAQGTNPAAQSAIMPTQSRKIGDIDVTPLSDGVLTTSLDVVLDLDRGEAERLSGKKIGDPVPIAVNAFLLKLRGKLVLVDTGSGNTMGPTLGKLPANLRALGVAPDAIDVILLTHLHPDHSNGLVDDDGRAIFSNAEIVLHANEASFWLDCDPASGASERIRRNI